MSNNKQSFGEQAARFSLYAPFVVMGIGLLARGNLSQPGVAVAIFSIDILLLSSAFVLGIVALVSMRRYGAKHILGRAVVGVLLNGIALASSAYLLLPLIAHARVKNELVGHWRLQPTAAHPAQQLEITFASDGTFQFKGSVNGTNNSCDGRWILTKEHIIGLTMEHVGRESPPEKLKEIGLGTVKTVDRSQMVIGTRAGDESYTRLP